MLGRVTLSMGLAVAVGVAGVAMAKGPRGHVHRRPYDPPAKQVERRPVDLVICLDTSGSMTQLIDSARGRLWEIVNELARMRPTPHLRVALLTYGSPHNSTAAAGYVVRQCDLTDDLDTVYAKMMAMHTNGGEEFVGWVLNDSLRTLHWSSDPRALRIIYVAGNESADQAANVFNFRTVAAEARERDIIINAIYAGDRSQGISEQWEEVARHGGGCFTAIDMACGTVQISTPYDLELQTLNIELNATYVPYGARGQEGLENQRCQDDNAVRLGQQSCASRVVSKSTALYSNSVWDLVDAMARNEVRLEEMEAEALPEPMRGLSVEEQRVYIERHATARRDVQKKIQTISEQRELYLRQQREKTAGGTALDEAMLKALREQAAARGFEVP